MSSQIDRYEQLDIDSVVVDRFQVRTTNTAEGIDELAASIKEFGLLHPIIVCRSDRHPNKWEVIAGQRRLLAHKKLNQLAVSAGVIDRTLTLEEGEAISANENLHQVPMSRADLVDLCERLFLRYGTIQAVADKTKIPYHIVRSYVRISRLDRQIREMVENREVDLDLAVKAQDAATVGGVLDTEEALKLIEVLKRSDGDLRKKILDVKRQNPTMPVERAEEEAEKPREDVVIRFRLHGRMAKAIRRLAADKGSDTNTVAMDLIEDALQTQGIVEEEE